VKIRGWETYMSTASARLVYGTGLLLLAAFVVMPQSRSSLQATVTPASELSTEDRLARAIHERIAIEAADSLDDAELQRLRAEEDGLRRLAFADDARISRATLVDALADALSAAMLTQSALASARDDDEDAAALERAQAVVRRLTAAINAEVRSLDT
jgi:hypothetical protein